MRRRSTRCGTMRDLNLEERSELRGAIRLAACNLSINNRSRAILRSAYAKLAEADRLPTDLTVAAVREGPFESIGEIAQRVAGGLVVADVAEDDHLRAAVAGLGDVIALRPHTAPSPARRLGGSRGYHRVSVR